MNIVSSEKGMARQSDLGATALKALAIDLRASRGRAVTWMLNRLADNGEMAGSAKRNGWARVPWALAVSGETEAAARVLAWAEREALTPDGDFREGPARGDGTYRAYPLAHLAIGAHLAGRQDMALALMGTLRKLQHPETGGMGTGMTGPDGEFQDMLATAQSGIAAIVTGQQDIVDNTYKWISQLWRDQPNLPQQLYCMKAGKALLTDPNPKLIWLALVDFTKPQQTYYNPGIAAVFLAQYGAMRSDEQALQLSREYLDLNVQGSSAQFDDQSSVQICKFGWGSAAMQIVDPGGDHLRHVVRMGQWFINRQADDGSWSPSRFLVRTPDVVDIMLKTAEHAMEVDVMISALGATLGRLE